VISGTIFDPEATTCNYPWTVQRTDCTQEADGGQLIQKNALNSTQSSTESGNWQQSTSFSNSSAQNSSSSFSSSSTQSSSSSSSSSSFQNSTWSSSGQNAGKHDDVFVAITIKASKSLGWVYESEIGCSL